MLIVLKNKSDLDYIIKETASFGQLKVVDLQEDCVVVLQVKQNSKEEILRELNKLNLPVKKIIVCENDFKLVGKQFRQKVDININNLKINDNNFSVIAGPCSVESEEQINRIAKEVAKYGASILRGGVFKARTSPYSFQGIGEDGVSYLARAAKENNLLSVTEILDIRDVDFVAKHIDILQIGARNMYNFSLLKEVARSKKPILLKRGFCARYQDLLLAAEYIYCEGNPNIILCERGIKTFENYTRNTLDINAVPVLKKLTHLPVFVDSSHSTGLRELVTPISLASVAAGAHGIMLEVHYEPDAAYSDGKQTIDIPTFAKLMRSVRKIRKALFEDI